MSEFPNTSQGYIVGLYDRGVRIQGQEEGIVVGVRALRNRSSSPPFDH